MCDVKKFDIVAELRAIAGEVCDHYCKWPDAYEIGELGEDEAAEQLFEEHCDKCPLLQFVE